MVSEQQALTGGLVLSPKDEKDKWNSVMVCAINAGALPSGSYIQVKMVHSFAHILPKTVMFLSLNTYHYVSFCLIFMSYVSMYLFRIDVFVHGCVEI